MSFRLFDTHCHLTWHADEDPVEDRLLRAEVAGVQRLLTVGVDIESSKQCAELAAKFPSVSASVGIHPNDLGEEQNLASLLGELKSLAGSRDFCAIGETGLDFFREWCAPKVQTEGFEFHLDLAREMDLPVIIHCREAGQAVLDVLRSSGEGVKGIMHCYSEGPDLVGDFLNLGMHISFAGNVTYPKSSHLREAALLVPADRLLVETDAPFLAPQPKRGQRNEPAYVAHTLSCLAEVRGIPAEELAELAFQNAVALLG